MLSTPAARIVRATLLVPFAALSLIAAAAALSRSPPQAHAQQPPGTATQSAPVPQDTVAPGEQALPGHRTALWLQTAGQSPILAYPPSREAGRAPLMLMLHGMCDAPQNECPSFAVPATAGAWLVCPRANLQCEGGGTIWSGDPKVRTALMESIMQRLHAGLPGKIDETAEATLIGFSLGSFVALDVAQRGTGPWKNLLLIGAKIEPDARLLQRAGIKSVLLASGDRDMMKWHMVGEAHKLRRRGMRATYMSMGDVGHWFAPDMDGWLAKAMAWMSATSEP